MDEAFAVFAAAQLPQLLRVAARIARDREEARDLVQEALLRVGERWGRIDNPAGYAVTVIARLHIDGWRARGHETLTAAIPDQPAAVDDLASAHGVRAALLTLPPRQRAVLVLRYYLDYSERQIADALGIRAGTVKSQASDGLARLGLLLQELP